MTARGALLSADIVLVACGALSSALLFLRSASDTHPNGLANGSDQVGRNYMRHNNATVLAISRTPNPTQFQKTLGVNDFYHGAAMSPANDWEFPLGHIQMVGKSDGAQVELEGLPALLHWLPQQPFDWIARHSIDFWLTTRRSAAPGEPHLLPRRRARISTWSRPIGRAPRACAKSCGRSATRWTFIRICSTAGCISARTCRSAARRIRRERCGSARTRQTSVLDLDCRAHEVDNLYVVDASFFPSIGAVNPTLTLIANALRVADIVAKRIGA